MSEVRRSRMAEEYADQAREVYGAPEETYRDGSLKNECWNDGEKRKEDAEDEEEDDERG